MVKRAIWIGAILLIPCFLAAQTVTVAPSGANFTSVRDAVNSFNPGGSNVGNTADNIIQITVGTTYVETGQIEFLADGTWQIICTDSTSSATLVIPSPENGDKGLIAAADTASPFDDGITGSVALENLVILPGDISGSGPTLATCQGVIIENNTSGEVGLSVKNVLISANNGSNQPASDGSALATGHFTAISGAGLRMLSGVNNLYLEDTVVTHCGTGVNDNGDILDTNVNDRTIGPGCSFNYNAGNGYYLSGGDLTTIAGTKERPVKFNYNAGFGIRFNSSVNDIGDVTYAQFIANRDEADTAIASGIHFVGTRQVNGRFYKCIIAFNGSATGSEGLFYGNISANNSQNTTFLFEACTILDAYSDQPTFTQLNNSSGDSNFEFLDCIIAGGLANTPDDFLRSSEADATVTITNSALVTQGIYSLDTVRPSDPIHAVSYSGTGGGGFIFNNIVFANPGFASIDPADPGFITVTNPVYDGAASTGEPLVGAGEFLPHYITSASSAWQLYQ